MPKTKKLTPSDPAESKAIVEKITKFLDEAKAADIVVFNVEGKSPYTDYMVIASGTSGRHVVGMARNLERHLADEKIKIHSVSGKTAGDWVLLDCYGVIVHLFRPAVRAYYDLERLWAE